MHSDIFERTIAEDSIYSVYICIHILTRYTNKTRQFDIGYTSMMELFY